MNQNDNLQNQHEYDNFFKNALTLTGSVTPKVIKKVCFIVIYTCLVTYLCDLFRLPALPIGPFEYGGFIMALILVFRLNAGHDRWWEARKLWGNIVNQSRNLSIILVQYTKNPEPVWLLKITNMISALPYLMKDNLRGSADMQYLSHLIDKEHIEQLNLSKHHPNVLLAMIAKELQIGCDNDWLDGYTFLAAQTPMQEIVNAQGACERILKTPMPFVMAIKSRRFILFFLLILPFALADISLYISPLIVGIVSYALFSIDQISIELQNPFSQKNLSHLPLDNICKTIEGNVAEIRDLSALQIAII